MQSYRTLPLRANPLPVSKEGPVKSVTSKKTLVLIILVLVLTHQIKIKKDIVRIHSTVKSYTSPSFHRMIGTGSYTTSTTNHVHTTDFTYLRDKIYPVNTVRKVSKTNLVSSTNTNGGWSTPTNVRPLCNPYGPERLPPPTKYCF